MSTDTASKLNKQILAEAAEWFVDFREGDVDAQRRDRFNEWLRTSPEHIRAYLEVSAFWADAPQMPSTRGLDTDALVAYALAEDNVVSLPSASNPQTHVASPPGAAQRRTFSRMSIAASVLIAFTIAMFAAWYAQRPPTYSTGIGEQRSIVLEDGSTVEMNARSRMQVRFAERSRDVELLEGQALFKVAKDATRPFIVQSGDTSVRAVGTQFDVYRRKSGTTVTVLEGRVAVSSLSSTLLAESASSPPLAELAAGEQVRVALDGAIEPPARTNAASATAWTQRQIVFEGTPLADVVEEFNRYNRRQMIIGDESIETIRISGVFSSTDPVALLRFLRELPMFSVDETDREIRITRKEGVENNSV